MASARVKILAVVEVLMVFSAAALAFRGLSASALLPARAGMPWPAYAAVLLIGLLAAARLGFAAGGIRLRPLRPLLRVAAAGLLPFLMLSGVLSFVNWRQPAGALIATLAALAALVITAAALKKPLPRSPASTLAALALAVPLSGLLGAVLLRSAYVYLLVAPAEEVLFRGYIQGRLNDAWGRPFRFFGVEWGWGAVISALLFGLWHPLLMPSAPGVWWQALWTAAAGLALAYLRERSQSVLPSSLLHGVMNYIPFSELL